MVLNIPEKAIKEIGDVILGYVFGKVADELYDAALAKHKVKKILKKDEAYIKEQFKTEDYYFIKTFLVEKVYNDPAFLYPVSDLPEDKAKTLWKQFCSYMEEADRYRHFNIDDERLEDKLKACVDKHNELVNKFFLSEKERIILKIMHKNQTDLFGYIGETLTPNTQLQIEDCKLDYAHKQIEGILRAFRMDMRHHKIILSFCSVGILIITFIFVIMLPKIIDAATGTVAGEDITVYLIILFIIIVVFSLLMFLFSHTIRAIRDYEKRIIRYMEDLWTVHFIRYEEQFKKLFMQDNDKTEI